MIQIPAERAIGASSLLTNLILVPFLFLILPSKLLMSGMTMLDLAFVEIALGVGIFFAATFLVTRLQKHVTDHGVASIGVVFIGLPILCFSFLASIPPMCIAAFALGCGLTSFNVTVNAKRTTAIPDGFRSTMEATLRFFCVLSVPFGLWLAQAGMDAFGSNSVIALAVFPLVSSMAIVLFSKSLRAMLNTPRDGNPYYLGRYARLFDKE